MHLNFSVGMRYDFVSMLGEEEDGRGCESIEIAISPFFEAEELLGVDSCVLGPMPQRTSLSFRFLSLLYCQIYHYFLTANLLIS